MLTPFLDTQRARDEEGMMEGTRKRGGVGEDAQAALLKFNAFRSKVESQLWLHPKMENGSRVRVGM